MGYCCFIIFCDLCAHITVDIPIEHFRKSQACRAFHHSGIVRFGNRASDSLYVVNGEVIYGTPCRNNCKSCDFLHPFYDWMEHHQEKETARYRQFGGSDRFAVVLFSDKFFFDGRDQ